MLFFPSFSTFLQQAEYVQKTKPSLDSPVQKQLHQNMFIYKTCFCESRNQHAVMRESERYKKHKSFFPAGEKLRAAQLKGPKLKTTPRLQASGLKSFNTQTRWEVVRAFNNEPRGFHCNYFWFGVIQLQQFFLKDPLLNVGLAGCNKWLKDTRLCEDMKEKLDYVTDLPRGELIKILNKMSFRCFQRLLGAERKYQNIRSSAMNNQQV